MLNLYVSNCVFLTINQGASNVLNKYLITMQQPSCVRSRYIVKATGTFDALSKVMDRMLKDPQPLDANSYLAARPATTEDIAKYGEWMV